MACRHNKVQPDATRIIWIQFPIFRYKYVQPMACRHNKMQPDATRIIWIQFPIFMYMYVPPMANCDN